MDTTSIVNSHPALAAGEARLKGGRRWPRKTPPERAR